MRDGADAERAAETPVVERARRAALRRMSQQELAADLSEDATHLLHQRMERLTTILNGNPAATEDSDRTRTLHRDRATLRRIQAASLAAARQEVLAARQQPGVDPEAADRVLHRLDQRTVLLD